MYIYIYIYIYIYACLPTQVTVEIIFNGCIVTIAREAACGEIRLETTRSASNQNYEACPRGK